MLSRAGRVRSGISERIPIKRNILEREPLKPMSYKLLRSECVIKGSLKIRSDHNAVMLHNSCTKFICGKPKRSGDILCATYYPFGEVVHVDIELTKERKLIIRNIFLLMAQDMFMNGGKR